MAAKRLPRGVRNNNPGNLRLGRDRWEGLVAGADPDFCAFSAPELGIRAMAKTLLTYENKRGANTVRKIIDRWAPPNENNTQAYIDSVADRMGVDPDQIVDLDCFPVMKPLVVAIIAHENANYAYPDKVVDDALRRAGVRDAPQLPLMRKTGDKVVGAGFVGLGLIAETAEPAKNAANQLADFTGAPVIAHLSTILLTVAGVAVLAGVARDYLKHRKGL